MALKTKKIVSLDGAWKQFKEQDRDGTLKDCVVCKATTDDGSGPKSGVLMVSNQRIAEAIKTGSSYEGHTFPKKVTETELANWTQEGVKGATWIFAIRAGDNPSIQIEGGQYGGSSGGGGGGHTASTGGGQGVGKGYSFAALVGLLTDCYREVRSICGENFKDEALQAAAATLFDAARQESVGVDAGGSGATSSMNSNMSDKLIETIEGVIKKENLWDEYAEAELPADVVIETWQKAQGNEQSFAIALFALIRSASASDARETPSTPSTDDGLDNIPF